MARDTIVEILTRIGPSTSGSLIEELIALGASEAAARRRVGRLTTDGVVSTHADLLPKRERFIALRGEYRSELYWKRYMEALRSSGSIYGVALDGLSARQGVVTEEEFAVISGAPGRRQNHVPPYRVLRTLLEMNIIGERGVRGHRVIEIIEPNLDRAETGAWWARHTVEVVMLESLRDWARKLGLASFNSIAIRGDERAPEVGSYRWDLTGPSYLSPLVSPGDGGPKNGFLVADAFAHKDLEPHHVGYFLRKLTGLKAIPRMGRILPVLLAQGFSTQGLRAGKAAGVIMATPAAIFGEEAAKGLSELMDVLVRAGSAAGADSERLEQMMGRLRSIEGASGNLRGILFELLVAQLLRREGALEMGRNVMDPETGRQAEIDLLCRVNDRYRLIECKGRAPGGVVSQKEVEAWLNRLPTLASFVSGRPGYADADIAFEIWTSGHFTPEALQRLQLEKQRRTKRPIDWKDGAAVRALAVQAGETHLRRALDEHFLRHPLADLVPGEADSHASISQRER